MFMFSTLEQTFVLHIQSVFETGCTKKFTPQSAKNHLRYAPLQHSASGLVSKPLSALPELFEMNTVSKGDFPHLFYLPKFHNYEGPIPATEWYDPDTKLLQWHAEQVADKVVFDFQSEMKSYCHMDVTILHEHRCRPFLYSTIAAVVFYGIYRQFFLSQNEIIVLQRPGNEIHSNIRNIYLPHF